MRLISILSGFVLASMSAGALAHPGSTLLTTGSKSPKAAMTEGVSFEDINGVHVFRGSPALQDAGLLGGEPASGEGECRAVEIEIEAGAWRSFRRLRTQGFYSGVSYPSRQYTQGFYSGRP